MSVVHDFFVFREDHFDVNENYFYTDFIPNKISEEEIKIENQVKLTKSERFKS